MDEKWQHARFELDFELGFGLDIILQKPADRYPTALPCIKKRRRVQFLIRNILRICTRLHFLIQARAVVYLSACVYLITHGFQKSAISPSLRSTPSTTLWLQPKTQPKTSNLPIFDQSDPTLQFWAGFWAAFWV